jgi:hypothetical protein
MLDETEAKQIKRLLKDRYQIEDLERLVDAAGEDYDSVVGQRANKTDAIKDILDQAELNGWMLELLEAMIEDFQERLAPGLREAEIAKINDVVLRIRERWGHGTALADPFKSLFVRGGRPFINRPQVSNAFAQLAAPAGRRIAVVDGPAASGKTYSKELPQFVAEIQGNQRFKVCYRNIGEGAYSLSAVKLVESILRDWKLETPVPEQLSQSTSYATELAEWMAAKVPRDETWWLIIDGLAKITPDPSVLNFLMGLASYIPDSPHPLRLVLLDLGEKNPLPLTAEALATKVQITPLTSADLVDHYFKTLHMAHAAERPFDAMLMATKAQWVLQKAMSQPGPPRIAEVLLEVTTELELIATPSG